MSKIDEILDYWIGPEDIDPDGWGEKQMLWYAFDEKVDNEIRTRFGPELMAAENGEREDWKQSERGCLALLVLYDQFSRNLYRGTPDVYKNDPEAVAVTDMLVESGALHALNVPAHILAFHAYHHAEDIERQELVLALADSLIEHSDEEWRESINSNLEYMKNHAAVIREFGRFPHRNKILGRDSTPEEVAHLGKDGRTFGQ